MLKSVGIALPSVKVVKGTDDPCEQNKSKTTENNNTKWKIIRRRPKPPKIIEKILVDQCQQYDENDIQEASDFDKR